MSTLAAKEKIKFPRKELRPLLYVVLALVLFAVIGQATCDRLSTLKKDGHQLITIAPTVFEIVDPLVAARLL